MKTMAKDILIVEDDEPIRTFLRELYHSEGFSVEEAENSDAAIVYLNSLEANEHPKMILTDIHQPNSNRNGIHLCELIAAQFPHIPCAVMSAEKKALDEVKSRAKELGVEYMLHKPFDASEALEVANRYIPNKHV